MVCAVKTADLVLCYEYDGKNGSNDIILEFNVMNNKFCKNNPQMTCKGTRKVAFIFKKER